MENDNDSPVLFLSVIPHANTSSFNQIKDIKIDFGFSVGAYVCSSMYTPVDEQTPAETDCTGVHTHTRTHSYVRTKSPESREETEIMENDLKLARLEERKENK